VDGYEQTKYNKTIGPDTRRRLAFSFRRAARATATTSSTTAAAFMANAFNPIMPLASFGIYAATLVSVVYVLIILYYPPIMVWVDTNLRGRWCPCGGEEKTEVKEFSEEEIKKATEPGKIEKFFAN